MTDDIFSALPRERAIFLRDLVIQAVDGTARGKSNAYVRLRAGFMGHPIWENVTPTFVRMAPRLSQAKSFIRTKGRSIVAQIGFVEREFAEMISAISLAENGSPPTQNDHNAGPVRAYDPAVGRPIDYATPAGASSFKWTDVDPFPPEEPTRSSQWTGQLTKKDRVRLVRAAIPGAMAGLEQLLADSDDRLHNHPPEAIDADGIMMLRNLHRELGELLLSIEAGNPIQERIERIASLTDRTFHFARDTWELSVVGIQCTIASMPLIAGTWLLLSQIMAPEQYPTVGGLISATILGGHFALPTRKEQKNKRLTAQASFPSPRTPSR